MDAPGRTSAPGSCAIARRRVVAAEIPAWRYMTPRPRAIGVDSPLEDARRILADVSGLPVVDRAGRLVGALSLSDLLTGPGGLVGDRMTAEAIAISIEAPLADAAAAMLEHRIHRVFVTDAGRLAGVLSTADLIRAVAERAMPATLGDLMGPAPTIDREAPATDAARELRSRRASALIAVEGDDWPVGIFTPRHALEAKAGARVEDVMDTGILCLDVAVDVGRAAARARAAGLRHIVVVHRRAMVGAVTDLDFARALARSQPALAQA
jgi:CBS domain-containing protein